MRLLHVEGGVQDFSLVEFLGTDIPPYAILSHTWGPDQDEVTFKDITDGTAHFKAGYNKIVSTRRQARADGLSYFWIDSCCIDKSSSAELSEAINSMFRWYREANRCYVYLADVSVDADHLGNAFCGSRWFTRGWTLQELLAPKSLHFFTKEWAYIGDKLSLLHWIRSATKIPLLALKGTPLCQFSQTARMYWAAGRQTKRVEDIAYSMLGIFDVHMPLIYGEGQKKAMNRLIREADEVLKQEVEGHNAFIVPHTEITMTRPSLVVFQDKLHCFHQSMRDQGQNIWQNVFDGNRWLGDVALADTTTFSGPSTAVFNNELFLFYQGGGGDKYGELICKPFHNSHARRSRNDFWVLSTSMVQYTGPSSVVFKDTLYCFYHGRDNNLRHINCKVPGFWRRDPEASNTSMLKSPSAVVYRDKIFCFHHRNRHQLCYNIFDGERWSGDVQIHDTRLSFSPSAVVYNDILYCFYYDDRSLWYNSFDGFGWAGDLRVPGTGLPSSPVAVVFQRKLYVFYQDSHGRGNLLYSTFDGSRWSEMDD